MRDIVARFQQEQGGLYKSVNCRTLLDDEVSSGALTELTEEFLFKAGEKDTIIVFVAGHGARAKSGRYFFLPPDVTPDRPARGIPREQQTELALNAIRILTSVVPGLFLALAIWVALRYPLSRAAHARILDQLHQRRRAG